MARRDRERREERHFISVLRRRPNEGDEAGFRVAAFARSFLGMARSPVELGKSSAALNCCVDLADANVVSAREYA
ncbi:hypothetical protein HPB52_017500 [Rhipicephalus sanguineus]|uniref:Uncharacterized protein n=1 Tax=Rhipicephalus sanguineus TaxID=34632 RepID=A0A9D4Q7D1_RHISA|nr:hypothetical protein HPB52_017500 [Rhipicephalus sanguineus]